MHREAKVHSSARLAPQLDAAGRDLLSRMLTFDPALRISAAEAGLGSPVSPTSGFVTPAGQPVASTAVHWGNMG